MRIRDRRILAPEPNQAERAAYLLEELASSACLVLNKEYYQRNRAKYPNHFHNRPGAFIERLSQDERDLLKHLVSDPDAALPRLPHLMLSFPEGHPENKIAGVLEWSPPTVWKLS